MNKHNKSLSAQVVDEAAHERRLSAWRKLARALVRAFRQLWALLTGGTIEDVKGDLGRVKRLTGKAADVAGSAIVGAGLGLDAGVKITHGAASTVGRILGALLPSQPIGPAAEAEASIARDVERFNRAHAAAKAALTQSLSSTPRVSAPEDIAALALETAALLVARGHDTGSRIMSPALPSDVAAWLLGLDNGQLRAVMAVGTDGIQDHLAGTRPIPGVRTLDGLAPAPARVVNDNDLKERVRAARRSFASEKGEAEATSKRGAPHRVAEPLYDDEPTPFPARRRGPGFY